ncbi:hypothetical protein OG535_35380 [Kitasatospora sp. NBC_00085]|uniref:hypothetical protein n=1 Tax=unclassified Kitasatospora TaxID=2633591 RepID=UPI003247CD98
MSKGLLRRIGRRGATTAAAVALAAGGVGLSAGDASADGWYYISSHTPSGHGVGLYSLPQSYAPSYKPWSLDLGSYAGWGDKIAPDCWTRGENINNQGNVWYKIHAAYSYNYNATYVGTVYVYGAYADGNWYFHYAWQNGAIGEC